MKKSQPQVNCLRSRYRKAVGVLLVLWSIGVLYGSLAPAEELPPTGWLAWIPCFDKIVHFGFYFGEVLLALLFFVPSGGVRWRWLLGIVLVSGVLECVQGGLGYRSMDGVDLLANALGAVAGMGAFGVVMRSRLRRCLLVDTEKA